MWNALESSYGRLPQSNGDTDHYGDVRDYVNYQPDKITCLFWSEETHKYRRLFETLWK